MKRVKVVRETFKKWLCSNDRDFISNYISDRVKLATCPTYGSAIDESIIMESPGKPVEAQITVTVRYFYEEERKEA